MGVGALVVSAVAAVGSTVSNMKAASEERKANRAQNRIAARKNQREQLANVRQNTEAVLPVYRAQPQVT